MNLLLLIFLTLHTSFFHTFGISTLRQFLLFLWLRGFFSTKLALNNTLRSETNEEATIGEFLPSHLSFLLQVAWCHFSVHLWKTCSKLSRNFRLCSFDKQKSDNPLLWLVIIELTKSQSCTVASSLVIYRFDDSDREWRATSHHCHDHCWWWVDRRQSLHFPGECSSKYWTTGPPAPLFSQ